MKTFRLVSVVVLGAAAVLVAPVAGAAPGAAVVSASYTCDGGVSVAADPNYLGNVVFDLVTGADVVVEEQFKADTDGDGARDVFLNTYTFTPGELVDHGVGTIENITAVFIKAGNNGSKKTGYGERVVPAAATGCVVDGDGDGTADAEDNCPGVANADQADRYGSPDGDACEDTDHDGTADVNETLVCISQNGVLLLRTSDAAFCSTSTPATEGGPRNFAYAEGTYASASAFDGDGNTATATGDGALANAFNGDGNTATATGNYATAFASNGDGNTATATGNYATTNAFNGDGNTATATGNYAAASAFDGDGNTATATGDGASAYAFAPDGCTADNTTCP